MAWKLPTHRVCIGKQGFLCYSYEQAASLVRSRRLRDRFVEMSIEELSSEERRKILAVSLQEFIDSYSNEWPDGGEWGWEVEMLEAVQDELKKSLENAQ